MGPEYVNSNLGTGDVDREGAACALPSLWDQQVSSRQGGAGPSQPPRKALGWPPLLGPNTQGSVLHQPVSGRAGQRPLHLPTLVGSPL